MPLPQRFDHQLARLDELHGLVMTRLRTWRHANPARRDPQDIRAALREYVDAVVEVVNGEN